MRWVTRALDLLGSALPAVLLAVVLIVVTANVIARTILATPFYVAHDIALISFAGVVWLGVIGAALTGQLFGVEFFIDRLPGRWRTGAKMLARVFVILIAAAVIRAAVAQITTARFTTFLALGWPKWIVSAGLLVAMAALIVVQLIAIATTLRNGQAAE
jgi:TRAP-type C4-dicarboxylate transport system permease small subunit